MMFGAPSSHPTASASSPPVGWYGTGVGCDPRATAGRAQGHRTIVYSAVFSPDDRQILTTGGLEYTVRVFRVITLSDIELLLTKWCPLTP